MNKLTEEQEEKIGFILIEILGLKLKNNRVYTEWGDKTPIGLTKTIQSIFETEDWFANEVERELK